jgi:putative DNA primase/helicase
MKPPPDPPPGYVSLSADDERPARSKKPAAKVVPIRPAQPDIPVIRLDPGALHENASQAETALISAGAPLYVRGNRLVKPVVDDVDAAKGAKTKVARLVPVTDDILVDYLSRHVTFEKYDHRRKNWIAASPPVIIAKIILSRDGEWKFRRLAGVITAPTMRPDGTLIERSGYDEPTGLLLLDPPLVPLISERPSQQQALEGLERLRGLLADFAFADRESRAVALSALITPVLRGALQLAPLHVMRAPAPASGKSYLVDCVSAIAIGRQCPVIAPGANEEETEKRLGAALFDGRPILSIDNLNGDLSGNALCQFVERPIVDVRKLGVSVLVRVESRATIFATGNNLTVKGDMVRRSIICTLDTNIERPELRHFSGDPIAMILADRGKYIGACLTIARAYLAAGCPHPAPPIASFPDWSRLVRSALIWLGEADPVITMEAARAEDPELSNLQAVVAAWVSATGVDSPKLAGEIAALQDQDLRAALLEIAPRGRAHGEIDPQRLGKWLKRYAGRVVGGLKISNRTNSNRKQLEWWLSRAT